MSDFFLSQTHSSDSSSGMSRSDGGESSGSNQVVPKVNHFLKTKILHHMLSHKQLRARWSSYLERWLKSTLLMPLYIADIVILSNLG